MGQPTPDLPAAQVAPRRWPLFLLGGALFLIGPMIVAVQVAMGQLTTPWHMPILASVGIVLMVFSVLQRRGILRSVGLAFFVLVLGFEWFMILVGSKTPAYTGPTAGQKIPEFKATLAGGQPLTEKDLEGGSGRVLLFFRGHW